EELLGVEPNELHADRLDRRETPQTLHPREGGVDSVPQTWSEPALGPGAVVKPWLPVPQLAPPMASEGATTLHRLADGVTTMLHLSQPQNVLTVGRLAHQSDACHLAAGVELHPHRLHDTADPVLQAHGERMHAHHHRSAPL